MNTDFPILTLKPRAEIHLKNKHHAIYQSAVRDKPKAKPGAMVRVEAHNGEFLCYATYNPKAYICARAIGFEERDPLEQIQEHIEHAISLRRALFRKEDTNCFRLVNAEGDMLPGLIVDEYAGTLVVQLTTLGMDMLKEEICTVLQKAMPGAPIFEKSTGQARKKEGLDAKEGWLHGEGSTDIEITERGVHYRISLSGSQKTGLFLDQRDMRSLVKEYAEGRTVLDCCSYVGGFSVNALLGGALHADAVDYDSVALERAKEHATMNGIAEGKLNTYAQDVFDFLRREPPNPYDFIILDPPAFAKRSSDIDQAKRAYTDMNRMAMQHLPKEGGLLLTCSCSYQIDVPLFQTIVFHAAKQAKRSVRILRRHEQAMDHPVNVYHPEVDYLKSLFLWVE